MNRTDYDIDGRQMDVPLRAGHALLRPLSRRGVEAGDRRRRTAVLSFDMEANGYGAILATPGEPSEAMKTLMQRMAAMTKDPLAQLLA